MAGLALGSAIAASAYARAAATPAGLRRIGNDRRDLWLHAGVWASAARGMDASCLSSSLESPAIPQPPPFRGLVFDSADSDDGHGINPSRFAGRSASKTPGIWPGHRLSLWSQHPGCNGWRAARRNVSGPELRTLGNGMDGCWRGLRSSRHCMDVRPSRAGASQESSTAISVETVVGTQPPWSLLFVEHGGRRHPSRPRSNLGPLSAFVRCFHFHRLLRHARGRPGRNRPWQHWREPDSTSRSAATATVAPAPDPRCQRNASFLSVFPGPGSPAKCSCVRPCFRAAGRAALVGLDVSCRLSLRCSASSDCDLHSIRGDRPDEQHRPHHLFQYYRRRLRTSARRVPSSASAWISVEFDLLRSRLRRARFADELKKRVGRRGDFLESQWSRSARPLF